jgi:hypothetical protein
MPSVQTQDLYYNVTSQTLDFDAPSRPASVTSVAVYRWNTGDDGTAETATTGSASVETNPDTTFDANSGVSSANPRLLNLAVTTGITVGRQYLATTADGATEWVDILEVTSGASCLARSPLHQDYVSADTFEGTRCSISVLDAWIQSTAEITDGVDPNPGYRIRWVWVDAGGVSHVDFTHCDVVRYRGADHGVTPADMVKFYDAWERTLPRNSREDGGQSVIDAAYERFEDDLTAIGVPDQQVRNRDVTGRIVRYAARRELLLQQWLSGGDAGILERFTTADQEYNGMFDKLFRVTSKVATGVSTAGDGTHTTATGVWSR